MHNFPFANICPYICYQLVKKLKHPEIRNPGKDIFFLLYTRKEIIARKSEKKFKQSNKNGILNQKTEYELKQQMSFVQHKSCISFAVIYRLDDLFSEKKLNQ